MVAGSVVIAVQLCCAKPERVSAISQAIPTLHGMRTSVALQIAHIPILQNTRGSRQSCSIRIQGIVESSARLLRYHEGIRVIGVLMSLIQDGLPHDFHSA